MCLILICTIFDFFFLKCYFLIARRANSQKRPFRFAFLSLSSMIHQTRYAKNMEFLRRSQNRKRRTFLHYLFTGTKYRHHKNCRTKEKGLQKASTRKRSRSKPRVEHTLLHRIEPRSRNSSTKRITAARTLEKTTTPEEGRSTAASAGPVTSGDKVTEKEIPRAHKREGYGVEGERGEWGKLQRNGGGELSDHHRSPSAFQSTVCSRLQCLVVDFYHKFRG